MEVCPKGEFFSCTKAVNGPLGEKLGFGDVCYSEMPPRPRVSEVFYSAGRYVARTYTSEQLKVVVHTNTPQIKRLRGRTPPRRVRETASQRLTIAGSPPDTWRQEGAAAQGVGERSKPLESLRPERIAK